MRSPPFSFQLNFMSFSQGSLISHSVGWKGYGGTVDFYLMAKGAVPLFFCLNMVITEAHRDSIPHPSWLCHRARQQPHVVPCVYWFN